MRRLQKSQSGFSLIEVLLALIFVAIVAFIGVYVAHNHKSKTVVTKAAAVVTTTKAPTTTSSSTSKAVTPAPQTQYLQLSQFGIELPLTSAISDLAFQNKNLESTSLLANQINQIAPECTPAGAAWATLEVIGTSNPGDAIATVTVGGTTYYLYEQGGAAECQNQTDYSSSPTDAQTSQIKAAIQAYDAAIATAFTNAKAL